MSLPISVLLDCPLVMLLLALGEPDVQFDASASPVQIQWDQRIALSIYCTDQSVQFDTVQQQLSGSRRIRADMGRNGIQRRYVGAEKPCFAVPDMNVAFGQLRAPVTKAFDFPALERESGFECVLYEVVMPCFLVDGDWPGGLFFNGWFVHIAGNEGVDRLEGRELYGSRQSSGRCCKGFQFDPESRPGMPHREQ